MAVDRSLGSVGRLALAVVALGMGLTALAPARAATPPTWQTAWTAAASNGDMLTGTTNYTCRFPLRSTIAGNAITVRLDNALANAAASFGAVSIEPAGPDLSAGPAVPLTFAGHRHLTLPAGAVAWSDPAPVRVNTGERLWVDVWITGSDAGRTFHQLSFQPMGCAPAGTGDRTGEATGLAFPQDPGSLWWVDALAVDSPSSHGTVVAVGDSLTDGTCNPPGSDDRWTDTAARRLSGALAVANEGIAGDTIDQVHLSGPTVIDRWNRDVADLPGVRSVVLWIGTNDLIFGATTDQVETGLRKLAAMAHARGLTVIGTTIIPRRDPYETPAYEAQRQQVNHDIRTGKMGFDRYVDLDALVRSPQGDSIDSRWDCGDRVHLNPTGYARVGNVFPLGWF